MLYDLERVLNESDGDWMVVNTDITSLVRDCEV